MDTNPSDSGRSRKLRSHRSSFTRNKTPYDRPASDRHASKSGLGSDMAARLVGSASRMLSSSTSYLLSYIFKPTPAVPQITEDAVSGAKAKQDSGESYHPIQIEESDIDPTQDLSTAVISEKGHKAELLKIEEIIKRRTLTREEFNRLTEMLRAKVVDECSDRKPQLEAKEHMEKVDSLDDIRQSDAPQAEAPQPDAPRSEPQRWKHKHMKGREETESLLWDLRLPKNVPKSHLKALDVGSSSPVEVARAFMGERSCRFAGQELLIPSEKYQEQQEIKMQDTWQQYEGVTGDRRLTPYAGKAPKRVPRTLGNPDPNSHMHFVETAVLQQFTPDPASVIGHGEKLKRSSSVLDNGCNTVGATRRIRLKTSTLAASSYIANAQDLGTPGRDLRNLAADLSGTRFHTPSKLLTARKNETDLSQINACSASVPMQSSRMAKKILDTLEKITPPKAKLMADESSLVSGIASGGLTNNLVKEYMWRSPSQIGFPGSHQSDRFSRKVRVHIPAAGTPTSFMRESVKTKDSGRFSSSLAFKEGDSAGNLRSSPSKTDESTKEISGKSRQFFALPARMEYGLAGELRSTSKIAAVDDIGSGSDGLRNKSVLKKPNSHDEANIYTQGSTSTISKPSAVCTATFPVFGGNSNLPQPEFLEKGNNSILISSPESTIDTTVSSFTFPLSSHGILFEPPTPKPFFSFSPFSTTSVKESQRTVGTISFDGQSPQYHFGTTVNIQKIVFSFTGSMISEQAASKPEFLFRHESKPELAFSNAAAASASSTQLFSHDRPFPFISEGVRVQKKSFFSSSTTSSAFACAVPGQEEKVDLQSDLIGKQTSVSGCKEISLQKPSLSGPAWNFSGRSSETTNGSSNEISTISTSPISASFSVENSQLPLFGRTSIPSGTAASSSSSSSASSVSINAGNMSTSVAFSFSVTSSFSSMPFSFAVSSNSSSVPTFSGSNAARVGLSCSETRPSTSFAALGNPQTRTENLSRFSFESSPTSSMPRFPGFSMASTGLHGSSISPETASSSGSEKCSSSMIYGSSSGPLFGSFTCKPFVLTGDSTSQTTSALKLPSPGSGLTSTALPPSSSVSTFGSLVCASTGNGGGASSSSDAFGTRKYPLTMKPPLFGLSSLPSSAPAGALGGTFLNNHISTVGSTTERPSKVSWNTEQQPPSSAPVLETASTSVVFFGQSSSSMCQPVFTMGSSATTEKPLYTSAQVGLGNNLTPNSSDRTQFAPVTLNHGGGFTTSITGGDKSGRRFIKARRTLAKK